MQLDRGGCPAVTGRLDGFREAQILLGRVRRGPLHFHVSRHYAPPAGHVFCVVCVLPSSDNSVAAPDPGSGRTYFLAVS